MEVDIYKELKPQECWRKLDSLNDIGFLKSQDCIKIADNVVRKQHRNGGWQKNNDYCLDGVITNNGGWDMPTFDNNATTTEISFLLRVYENTKNEKYLESAKLGILFILNSQYENGGFPISVEIMYEYQKAITFNDNVMVNILSLLMAIKDNDLFSDLKDRIEDSIARGIDCILNTQLKYKDSLGVWCQQYDKDTLEPCKGRAYELPSFTSLEGTYITLLLMEINNPSDRIIHSVNCSINWFEENQINGYKIVKRYDEKGKISDVGLIQSDEAKPLWARFYDLDECKPLFCDRSGVPKRNLDEINLERRIGYSWYNSIPLELNLFGKYEKWKLKIGK